MHAIRQYEFGPADTLRYEQLPDPDPGEGQVRIAVEAAGVHLLDTQIRQGEQGGPFPPPQLPMTPGREVAGTIDAVSPGAWGHWVGQRVVAHLGKASGGYAEHALAPVAALHEIPERLSAEAAVAMIGTGRTAVGVLEVAALRPGDVVLVTAAAGGLGSLFVQAARNVGATAVGVAGGAEKVDQVRALGAAVAVDYREPGWAERLREELGARTPTVLLDGVGGALGRGAFELLDVGGRVVMFGWSSGEPLELTTTDLVARGLTATWAIGPRLLRRPDGLRSLETESLREAATGRLRPLVDTRFPLSSAADAHRAVETRATVGKTVLIP